MNKTLFRCIATAILAIGGSTAGFCNQSVIVDCKQGGQPVVTSGLTSTTKVLQSFPSCTITVNIHGGGLATLFSDNVGTPLANPFTAQNNPYTGAGFFYAANGHVDITISGGGLASPITFSDIILNDPGSTLGCSQMPIFTGDVTSAGNSCTLTLPNIATPGTGLKTTINAKGQATGVTTAASTDLSDTAIIARLNAPANFGANAISGGALSVTTGVFSGSISGTGATFTSEVAPSVTGVQLGDAAHRWDLFARNLDFSGALSFANLTVTNLITQNFNSVLNAAQFAGADIHAKANTAAASCGITPCKVMIPPGTYNAVTTTLNCVTGVTFDFSGSTINYSGAGIAQKCANVSDSAIMGPFDLIGPGTGGATIGIQLGIGLAGTGVVTVGNVIAHVGISNFNKGFVGEGSAVNNGTFGNTLIFIRSNSNNKGFVFVPAVSNQYNQNPSYALTAKGNLSDGITIDGANGLTFISPWLEQNGGFGWNFAGTQSTSGNYIAGSWNEANTSGDFRSGSGTNVFQNTISGGVSISGPVFSGVWSGHGNKRDIAGVYDVYGDVSMMAFHINSTIGVGFPWGVFNDEGAPGFTGVIAVSRTGAGAGAGAGNLFIGTAEYPPTIRQSLISDAAGTRDIGTTLLPFGNIFVGGAATNNNKITSAVTTGARIFTLPDANSNSVQPDTGAANNFLTAISALGVISKAQPSFSNLSGSIALAQTPLTTNGDLFTVTGGVLARLATGISTQVLHGTNIWGSVALATDVSGQLPISAVGSAGLSGTSPMTISAAGAIACATCVTSAASLTLNQLVFGGGGQASAVGDLTGDVTTAGGKSTTVAKIAGTTVSGTTGSGNVVFSTSPTFTTQILLPDGALGAPAMSFASDTTSGIFKNGAFDYIFGINSLSQFRLTATQSIFRNGNPITWASSGISTPDTGLSRGAADEVDCGNGTQADKTCLFKLGTSVWTESAAPTNVASSGSLWEDSTSHEWQSATAGSSNAGLMARVQPGAIHQTAKTAAITTATLCASSAGACNVAGLYNINWSFWEDGTACGTPGTGGVTFLLTWTDFNGSVHSAVSLGMDDASAINAVSQTFHFQTSNAAAWASGNFNIATNGAIIQYATGYTACGVGTGSYGLDIGVTRLR